MHLDGEHFWAQSRTVAGGAGDLAQVLCPTGTRGVGLGLCVLALDVRHDALEAGAVGHLPPETVAVLDSDLVLAPLEDRLADFFRELLPGRCELELDLLGETEQEALVVLVQALALPTPRQDDPVCDRVEGVADEELTVDGHPRSQPVARLAGAERRVEGEGPRLDLSERDGVVVRAGELLGERGPRIVALRIDEVDLDEAVREPQRRLE